MTKERKKLKFDLMCCGERLTSKADVLRHHAIVDVGAWAGEPFTNCEDHGRGNPQRWSCQKCFNAEFLNEIDRELQAQGKTLSNFTDEECYGGSLHP